MRTGSHLLEQVAVFLVVVAVALNAVGDVLPRVLPGLIVLGGLFIAIRLVLFYTRRW